MGASASNPVEGRPICSKCGEEQRGGTSRVCFVCDRVYCGNCKKTLARKDKEAKARDGKAAKGGTGTDKNPSKRLSARLTDGSMTPKRGPEQHAWWRCLETKLCNIRATDHSAKWQWSTPDQPGMWIDLPYRISRAVEAAFQEKLTSIDDYIDGRETIVYLDSMQMECRPERQCHTKAKTIMGLHVIPSDCKLNIKRIDRVRLRDFEMLKVLGHGAHGKVMLVRKKTPPDLDEIFALKVIRKEHKKSARAAVTKETWQERTYTERNILAHIHHPFLANMRYAFQSGPEVCLVMDFYAGGELFFLQNNQPNQCFTEAQVQLQLQVQKPAAHHSPGGQPPVAA
jgi:hypothetical protein